jgi:hypothetical protein
MAINCGLIDYWTLWDAGTSVAGISVTEIFGGVSDRQKTKPGEYGEPNERKPCVSFKTDWH